MLQGKVCSTPLRPRAVSGVYENHKLPRGHRAVGACHRGVSGAWSAAAWEDVTSGNSGQSVEIRRVGRDATCGGRVEQSRVGGWLAAGSGSESRGQEGREGRLATLHTLNPLVQSSFAYLALTALQSAPE